MSRAFDSIETALLYDKYRPKYHHIPFANYYKLLERKFASSLDVACGAGLSTEALAKISEKTVGCDISRAMLEVAQAKGLEIIEASASHLPFGDNSFDCVNISLGFHWVDQEAFLAEAHRVLKSGGYLTIDHHQLSENFSDDVSRQKMHEAFFENHLAPATASTPNPSLKTLRKFQFNAIKEWRFEHSVRMSLDTFINMLKTWSHFQILPEGQQQKTEARMQMVYKKIFEDDLVLCFKGRSWLFQVN